MIWWITFAALSALSTVAARRFVPAEHLQNYRQCRRDRTFWLANLFSHSIWIVAAAQSVVAPASHPVWLRIVGVGFIIAGQALMIWAWRVNNLFVPAIIYVPPDMRVTDGPYRLCDHPGYLGLFAAASGDYLLLGQRWAMVPLAAYHALLLSRVFIEDRVLSKREPS